MSRNIEIKARVADLASVRAIAASLASTPSVVIEQADTFFVVPAGRLKVRACGDGTSELIAYDRPDDRGPKTSVYSLVRCGNAEALVRTLSTVLAVRGRVQKRRELFLVGRTRVHLDQVEQLGSFVELEVVLGESDSVEEGQREAEALMRALGIERSALVSGAYIDLLERRP